MAAARAPRRGLCLFGCGAKKPAVLSPIENAAAAGEARAKRGRAAEAAHKPRALAFVAAEEDGTGKVAAATAIGHQVDADQVVPDVAVIEEKGAAPVQPAADISPSEEKAHAVAASDDEAEDQVGTADEAAAAVLTEAVELVADDATVTPEKAIECEAQKECATPFMSPSAHLIPPSTCKSVYATPGAVFHTPESSPAVKEAMAEPAEVQAQVDTTSTAPSNVAARFVAVADAVASGVTEVRGNACRSIAFSEDLVEVKEYTPAKSVDTTPVGTAENSIAAIDESACSPFVAQRKVLLELEDKEIFEPEAILTRGELVSTEGLLQAYDATVGDKPATLVTFVGDGVMDSSASAEKLEQAVVALREVPGHVNVLRPERAEMGGVVTQRVNSMASSGFEDGCKSGSFSDVWLYVRMCLDIARGMAHLHQHGVMHQHLNATAVVAACCGNDATQAPETMCKVAFAGLAEAREALAGMRAVEAQLAGYATAAPEVIERTGGGEAADTYQYSLVMWELWCGAKPFAGLTPAEVALGVTRYGMRPRLPQSMPTKLVALMKSCWSQLPADRPSFDDIVKTLERLEYMPVSELFADTASGAVSMDSTTPTTPSTDTKQERTPTARPVGRRLRRALKLARFTPGYNKAMKKRRHEQKSKELSAALKAEGMSMET